jgi:hypothetical protein
VGVDYAGPFYICVIPGRNPRQLKSYVCVFVCLQVKAVHFELAEDLSTAAFIAAFRRFVARRGATNTVICDGGRNFLGAKNEMDLIQNLFASSAHQNKVSRFFVDQEIEYIFNPPYAPHHGGIFEAAVKSMKLHLSRVVQDRRLSIMEFSTLLCQVEAILNSRPITPMSTDPNDFGALTPGHFITGGILKALPQENLEDRKIHQMTRWQHVQQMTQHFDRRWRTEYLQTLQKSTKWFKDHPNLHVGTLVLLNDSESIIGPQKWILGRISEVFPGKDDKVRVCDVTIPSSDDEGNVKMKTYRRPITKLSPLPIYS